MRAAHPQIRSARRVALPAAVIAVALALAGCAAEPPSVPAPTASATTEPGADAGTAPDGGADAAPIAETEAVVEQGTVGVALRSLTRDSNGETMTLRIAFTPDFGEAGKQLTLSGMNNYFFVFPVLLDRENLKRYSVLEGDGTQDWLMNKDAKTGKGEPLESWFVFAAPEDDVDTISVTIDEWSVEFPDVKIEPAS